MHEGPQGGQTGIAAAQAVVTNGLEVLEEPEDSGTGQVRERVPYGLFAELALEVLQEQSKGVAVGRNCAGTGATLVDQILDEEALQERAEIRDLHRIAAHGCSPPAKRSKR